MHRIPRDVEWNVMYDVACTLVRHLKTSDDREYLLDRIKFSLPSFHAFGHNAACKVIHNFWHLLYLSVLIGVK